MDSNEKVEILNGLQLGLDTLMLAILELSEDSAKRKPGEGKWSILECMEHIAIAEEYMFSQITSSSKSDVPVINKGREALIRKRGADRSRKIESPDVARPNGRFQTLGEATQYFCDARRRTLDFVGNCNADLRATMAIHPVLGPVNCYEMLLIMSAHPLRHSQQIAEIRNK